MNTKLQSLISFVVLSCVLLISCDEEKIVEKRVIDTVEVTLKDTVEVTKTINDTIETLNPFATDFSLLSSIALSGQGVAEISAYDKITQQVFSTNTENKVVEVIDISKPASPALKTTIDVTQFGGNLNSVAVNNGLLAIAVEGDNKQTDPGKIIVYDTKDLTQPKYEANAGYLPDMIVFTPDGKFILTADEGEPNDDNTIDPKGSVSIMEVASGTVTTLDFTKFNGMEALLEEDGFRVFGETNGNKNALDVDVEPEYITVSDDSKTAYVALQENNGIAVVDIQTKDITKIIPLGTKDYSAAGNQIDVSDKDDVLQFKNWNVKSFYMPDAIDYFQVGGVGYLISANEGDARDYDGFSEEKRLEKIQLDETVFPNAEDLQKEENLGRLKITTANGDTDGDGDYDEIYGYGARSFTIWNTDGAILYDSKNFLTTQTNKLGTYTDNRSDDKGAEPESVVTHAIGDHVYAFVGLERTGDVFVFNISNPASPVYLQNLRNTSPEGLLVIPAADSPSGKLLLVVSNEFPDKEAVDEDGATIAKLNIFSK